MSPDLQRRVDIRRAQTRAAEAAQRKLLLDQVRH